MLPQQMAQKVAASGANKPPNVAPSAASSRPPTSVQSQAAAILRMLREAPCYVKRRVTLGGRVKPDCYVIGYYVIG